MAVRGSLRRNSLRRGLRLDVTCPAACTVDAELRQGRRVLAHRRFTHAGRLTLHLRAVRPGRLQLSLNITFADQTPVKLTRTI